MSAKKKFLLALGRARWVVLVLFSAIIALPLISVSLVGQDRQELEKVRRQKEAEYKELNETRAALAEMASDPSLVFIVTYDFNENSKLPVPSLKIYTKAEFQRFVLATLIYKMYILKTMPLPKPGELVKTIHELMEFAIRFSDAFRDQLRQAIEGFDEDIEFKAAELRGLKIKSESRAFFYKLFSEIRETDSKKNPPGAPFDELEIDTGRWDRVPCRMANMVSETITLQPSQKVFLAGDQEGKKGLIIDNFLYLEFKCGNKIVTKVCGLVEKVLDSDKIKIENIKPTSSCNVGQVDLTPYFPLGETVTLNVYALDYGGVYLMSDIYLIIK